MPMKSKGLRHPMTQKMVVAVLKFLQTVNTADEPDIDALLQKVIEATGHATVNRDQLRRLMKNAELPMPRTERRRRSPRPSDGGVDRIWVVANAVKTLHVLLGKWAEAVRDLYAELGIEFPSDMDPIEVPPELESVASRKGDWKSSPLVRRMQNSSTDDEPDTNDDPPF